MNYLKKLGLACLVATAALGVAGAGTATAKQSVLCKVNETPCKSENRYSKGTGVALESTGVLEIVHEYIPEFFGCKEFELNGEIVAAGGSAETAALSIPSQSNLACTCSQVSFKAENLRLNWVSGTMNGTGRVGKVEFSFYCPSTGAECAYAGEESESVTLTGGNPALLTFNLTSLSRVAGGDVLCGESAGLTAEFDIIAPGPLYVSTA